MCSQGRLTVDVTVLAALDEVGLQELGNLLGMLDSGGDGRVVRRQRGLFPEPLADLLLCGVENPRVAWDRNDQRGYGGWDGREYAPSKAMRAARRRCL